MATDKVVTKIYAKTPDEQIIQSEMDIGVLAKNVFFNEEDDNDTLIERLSEKASAKYYGDTKIQLEGNSIKGKYSIGFGYNNFAETDYAMLFGQELVAPAGSPFIIGKYNVGDTAGNHPFIIGAGTAEKRKNIFSVSDNGDVKATNFLWCPDPTKRGSYKTLYPAFKTYKAGNTIINAANFNDYQLEIKGTNGTTVSLKEDKTKQAVTLTIDIPELKIDGVSINNFVLKKSTTTQSIRSNLQIVDGNLDVLAASSNNNCVRVGRNGGTRFLYLNEGRVSGKLSNGYAGVEIGDKAVFFDTNAASILVGPDMEKYIDRNNYKYTYLFLMGQNIEVSNKNVIQPDRSFSIGSNTFIYADNAFSQGYYTSARGYNSHAEGYGTMTIGRGAHAEGIGTGFIVAGNEKYIVENFLKQDLNNYLKVVNTDDEKREFEKLKAKMLECFNGEGDEESKIAAQLSHFTAALGNGSHAEGSETFAIGNNSHTEGYKTLTEGDSGHAEGRHTHTTGAGSHAEGHSTESKNTASHAEGFQSVAEGEYSHAQNWFTIASGKSSTAMGHETQATGENSLAGGSFSHANGENSIVLGHGLASSTNNQFVIGTYNKYAINEDGSEASDKNIFVIGNGTAEDKRSNVVEVSDNKVRVYGVIQADDFLDENGESIVGSGGGGGSARFPVGTILQLSEQNPPASGTWELLGRNTMLLTTDEGVNEVVSYVYKRVE